MPSEVERSSDSPRRRVVSRRGFLTLAGSTTTLVLLAACQGGTPPPQAPSATSAPLAARTVAPIQQATSAPAAAAPTAAPAVAQAGPKGKLTEAWNVTIAPAWLDPQENPPQVTPYHFAYALHDAVVKPMPGKEVAPSLAESYEVAPDFKSATFKLRQGIKFHDGTPVTPDDVKFTYESYRGASAKVLHDKLDHIDIPDDRTVKFVFKEPFVDFMTVYGSPASGAAWVVPKAYYQKVGKDGFKQAPIGAGPFRFVKQTSGESLELEAFDAYWRKTPSVKSLVIRGTPELATRVALLKTGEVDVSVALQGDLLSTLRKDPNQRLTAVRSAATWVEMFGLDSPDHPLKDPKVRQAVSLAIDRQAINDAELDGLSKAEGNWVPEDWQGALQRPAPPFDVAKAKQLLAEAGVPNGFDISQITPLPPYTTWAERVATQLRAININMKVNTLERGAFYDALAPGPNRLKGLIIQFSSAPGDAASRIRENAVTGGTFSGLSDPEVDNMMKKYDSSIDMQERKQLLDAVQARLLDQYYMLPLMRSVQVTGFSPRVANKPEDISGVIPQYIYIGPFEDLQLKDA